MKSTCSELSETKRAASAAPPTAPHYRDGGYAVKENGASVSGEIVEQTRGDRILVFKKRRRQISMRSRGHRQDHTLVKITDIAGVGGASAPAEMPAAAAEKE